MLHYAIHLSIKVFTFHRNIFTEIARYRHPCDKLSKVLVEVIKDQAPKDHGLDIDDPLAIESYGLWIPYNNPESGAKETLVTQVAKIDMKVSLPDWLVKMVFRLQLPGVMRAFQALFRNMIIRLKTSIIFGFWKFLQI